MEQYYIATAEGKTKGPYYLESVKVQCNCGMITPETLVCVVGGQEWVEFKTVLAQKGETVPSRKKIEEVREKLYDPAWGSSEDEAQEINVAQKPLTEITVEDMFRGIGIIALIAGVVLPCLLFKAVRPLPFLNYFLGPFPALAASGVLKSSPCFLVRSTCFPPWPGSLILFPISNNRFPPWTQERPGRTRRYGALSFGRGMGAGLFKAFIDHVHAPLTEKLAFRRGGLVPGVKGGIIYCEGDCIFCRAWIRCRGVSRGGVLLHEKRNHCLSV